MASQLETVSTYSPPDAWYDVKRTSSMFWVADRETGEVGQLVSLEGLTADQRVDLCIQVIDWAENHEPVRIEEVDNG